MSRETFDNICNALRNGDNDKAIELFVHLGAGSQYQCINYFTFDLNDNDLNLTLFKLLASRGQVFNSEVINANNNIVPILDCLIETAKNNTDLDNVYCDSKDLSFSWKQVNNLYNCLSKNIKVNTNDN